MKDWLDSNLQVVLLLLALPNFIFGYIENNSGAWSNSRLAGKDFAVAGLFILSSGLLAMVREYGKGNNYMSRCLILIGMALLCFILQLQKFSSIFSSVGMEDLIYTLVFNFGASLISFWLAIYYYVSHQKNSETT